MFFLRLVAIGCNFAKSEITKKGSRCSPENVVMKNKFK